MHLPFPEEESGILTVSRLNEQIKALLESEFPFVWVKGEISNFRMPSSGHFYFTLKDEHSQIRAVFFRSQNRFLRFVPEDGLQTVCQARVGVYEPRGEYQLIVDVMEPLGAGALQLAFEQLKKKLEAEGLFDSAAKKPLPLRPQHVCIITSPTGAAIRDILKVLERSPYPVGVTLFPVAVQGQAAGAEIAGAIVAANALASRYGWDVILVGRGGGSIEDLWPFNEEAVARAVAASSIPVVSAVGHEIDFTICDFAADARMPTPTAAAEWAVGQLERIHRDMSGLCGRLEQAAVRKIENAKHRVKLLEGRIADPKRRLENMRLFLDDRVERLTLALDRRIERLRTVSHNLRERLFFVNPAVRIHEHRADLGRWRRELVLHQQKVFDGLRFRFQDLSTRLEILSPLAVLNRGYSIVYRLPSMRIVRDASGVYPGDGLRVRLAKGALDCTVQRRAEDGDRKPEDV